MSRQSLPGMTVAIYLAAATPLLANGDPQSNINPRTKTISLQWEDLAPIIAGQEVEIILPDGTKLKGDVYAVQQNNLVMDVKRTSNRGVYPKGQQSIDRALVSSLDLRKKTIRWRVIATTAGVVAGFFTGGLVFCVTDSIAWGLTTWAGIPIGLHIGARPVDVQVTRIEIVAPGTAGTSPVEEN